MTRSLYEIDDELSVILTAMEECEGDPSIVGEAIDAWLDANRDEITDKIDAYCAVIQSKKAMADARREEANKLTAMANADIRVSMVLTERIKAFFEKLGIEKMETRRFKPRIVANGGFLPVNIEGPAADLPTRYQITRIEADIAGLRADLLTGEKIPGVTLGERGTHFRLR